jgi:hypothetical protein
MTRPLAINNPDPIIPPRVKRVRLKVPRSF